jgi:hypothetical protein
MAPVRRLLILIALPALAAGALAAPARASTLPAPTLVASAVSSDLAAPCGPPACAVPTVLAVVGSPFNLTVTLTASGAPAAFSKATALTLTATGPGVVSPSSVTMPANVSSFTFTGLTYSTYANDVTVTATAPAKKGVPASTPSNAFDVLQTLKTDNASAHTPFQDGAGPGNCAAVSATNPVCGVLVLPNGSNSNVLLSTGSCANIGCNAKGTVTQVIADLTSQPLYSSTTPAKLIIKCYRTICGSGGVNKYTVGASLASTGALVNSPACPAKNTLGATQDFCTDYVSSNRANADELDLVLLFDRDLRGSIT